MSFLRANPSEIDLHNFIIVTLRFFEVSGARYRLDTKSLDKLICPSSPPQKSHLLMIRIYTKYLSCRGNQIQVDTISPDKLICLLSSLPKSYLLIIQIYTKYLSHGRIHRELIYKARTARESWRAIAWVMLADHTIIIICAK